MPTSWEFTMKNLSCGLVVLALFSLAACGASEEPGTSTADATPAHLLPAAADGATVVLNVNGMT